MFFTNLYKLKIKVNMMKITNVLMLALLISIITADIRYEDMVSKSPFGFT